MQKAINFNDVAIISIKGNDYRTTSSPAHLFAIRGRPKRGPGTLQTRDQNLPK